MAARPAAPEWMQDAAFSNVIPPIAITGRVTARQTCFSRSKPCGVPNAALDGVVKTGPKTM
jgi:hypothetical protein